MVIVIIKSKITWRPSNPRICDAAGTERIVTSHPHTQTNNTHTQRTQHITYTRIYTHTHTHTHTHKL
jgi:hypothetical protein